MDKMVERKLILLIPASVNKIASILNSAGHQSYVVGGAIRDIMIGKEDPKEWDMATSAKPQEVVSLFDHIYMLGAKFGTITVIMENLHVEVTTFRTESDYIDKRHPQNVDFVSDIKEDLARRDFTINAMAFDPINGTFLDLFGGIEDIELKIIKTVGNPETRFREDGLRMMRAVRFATVLGYELEETTFNAIKEFSNNIAEISKERTRDEFIKILSSSDPKKGILLLKQTGLLENIFPQSFDLSYINEACRVCESLRNDFDLRIAALILVLKGQPDQVLPRLKLPKKESRRIKNLVKMSDFDFKSEAIERQVRRFALISGRGDFIDSLFLLKALKKIDYEVIEIAQNLLETDFPFSINELKISGTDLINECGLKPGAHVKVILENLLEEVVENKVSNKYEDLMKNAQKFTKLERE